jgi:hypothetical protein
LVVRTVSAVRGALSTVVQHLNDRIHLTVDLPLDVVFVEN